MEVLDKGKAAAVTTIIETRDRHSGKVIFENQMTAFIRGAGGFGGRRAGKGAVCILKLKCTNYPFTILFHLYKFILDRGAASAPNVPPRRVPDAVVEEKTSTSQAALYR
jgi:multifunctional beta-oxidation protein